MYAFTRLAWPGSIASLFEYHGLPDLAAEYEQVRANIAARSAQNEQPKQTIPWWDAVPYDEGDEGP